MTDWRPMSEAPRDGTWIEIQNSWGAYPTYDLARWTDQVVAHSMHSGGKFIYTNPNGPDWLTRRDQGYITERVLMWHPYSGDRMNYTDPTRGAQYTRAYWGAPTEARPVGSSIWKFLAKFFGLGQRSKETP
jgi:hypothetical protein